MLTDVPVLEVLDRDPVIVLEPETELVDIIVLDDDPELLVLVL